MRGGASGRRGPGLPGHGDRERERGAAAGAVALGPDAPAVRLDEPLADREPEAVARRGALSGAGVPAKETRQPLRRHSRPLVGDRNGDVRALVRRRDPDGGRGGSVPRGVGEEVVEHLHDAPPVGHHRGQAGRQVDEDGVAPAAAHERGPRAFHQVGHLRGLGRDRERARLDAPRVQQVADQPAHVSGLLDDDAVELAHLGRLGSAASSSSVVAEPLMAVSGSRSPRLRPRNSVRSRSISSSGASSCKVTTIERMAAPSARIGVALIRVRTLRWDGEHDLLGAHRLARGECLRQRKLAQ